MDLKISSVSQLQLEINIKEVLVSCMINTWMTKEFVHIGK